MGWLVGVLALALAASLATLVVLIVQSEPFEIAPRSWGPPLVVEVTSQGFRPAVVIAQPGVVVRWHFVEGRHTVTESTGLWDSGERTEGWFERRLEPMGSAGAVLEVRCRDHGTVGVVHVLPPAPSGEEGGSLRYHLGTEGSLEENPEAISGRAVQPGVEKRSPAPMGSERES